MNSRYPGKIYPTYILQNGVIYGTREHIEKYLIYILCTYWVIFGKLEKPYKFSSRLTVVSSLMMGTNLDFKSTVDFVYICCFHLVVWVPFSLQYSAIPLELYSPLLSIPMVSFYIQFGSQLTSDILLTFHNSHLLI